MLTALHPRAETHLISLDTAQMCILAEYFREKMYILPDEQHGRKQSTSLGTRSMLLSCSMDKVQIPLLLPA